MRFKYLLFFVLSFVGFSHSAFAGHLFSQNSLNTPVTISAGTGVVIHQLGYESASVGQLGNFSIDFNQNSSANAALAWSTGDSLKITIGNYSLTVNYDTPGGTITNSVNATNSARGTDSVLRGLTLSPTPASQGISTVTLPAQSTGYVWTIEALTGSFSFEGYRIYFAGATFDGTNADMITQASVITQQQIQQQVPSSNPAPTIPDINAGNDSSATINKLSNVGNSLFTNRFNGGTLKVDVTNTDATAAFTIAGHSAGDQGYIDQNSKVATFSGVISDDGATPGRLVILNGDGSSTGGKIILANASNTYSGGTEVRPGAKLSIGYAGSIGSGGLDLIGSSTVPAILETTRTMEISSQITVTGDPVFSVTPTTTLTVSSPITNGLGGAGDVVAAGGGTLNLTAVNTYTGSTSIIEGSTLNLTGAGSIATSIGFNNSNGTFNIAGANGNVSLGGDYGQASTGNLSMNISATNNQKLLVTGAASLAGGLSLAASSGNYTAGRYTLISANGVSGSFGSLTTNLPTYTRLGYQLGYDANNVYLYLTPNLSDTQASLQNSANLLQGTFTLQNSVLVNGFTYDCPVFDKNGICVSAGGRNTTVQAEGINNTSGLLIASYQLDKDYSRIGAYVDQNLSMSGPGTVKMSNSTPMIGLFAVWAENLDTTGWGARIGAAYGQKNTTVTRQVVNTSEPGSGSANLNTQGAQLTGKYGFAVMDDLIVSPYVGIRYTQNNMGGYTEGASASVTSPLTYSALNTNATTALAGAETRYKLDPKTTVFASAGVETDTNTKNGTYSATGFGLTNLTPINFNPNPVKTRPTATVGGYYDIEKNHRIGVTGIYRQEPFQAVSTTTVMATYTVGM